MEVGVGVGTAETVAPDTSSKSEMTHVGRSRKD